mmetsp:Transcript_38228/g.74809  ORF Transcript_38228/g.74809 Transcript_38228/m.74809 type:complete len:380 (+) Transcript_38228:1176-2315(+)
MSLGGAYGVARAPPGGSGGGGGGDATGGRGGGIHPSRHTHTVPFTACCDFVCDTGEKWIPLGTHVKSLLRRVTKKNTLYSLLCATKKETITSPRYIYLTTFTTAGGRGRRQRLNAPPPPFVGAEDIGARGAGFCPVQDSQKKRGTPLHVLRACERGIGGRGPPSLGNIWTDFFPSWAARASRHRGCARYRGQAPSGGRGRRGAPAAPPPGRPGARGRPPRPPPPGPHNPPYGATTSRLVARTAGGPPPSSGWDFVTSPTTRSARASAADAATWGGRCRPSGGAQRGSPPPPDATTTRAPGGRSRARGRLGARHVGEMGHPLVREAAPRAVRRGRVRSAWTVTNEDGGVFQTDGDGRVFDPRVLVHEDFFGGGFALGHGD